MNTLNHSEPAPTLEEVWRLFKETDQRMKETDQQVKETGQQIKETGQQIKETDRKLKESYQEARNEIQAMGQRLEASLAASIEQITKENIRQKQEVKRWLEELSQRMEARMKESSRKMEESSKKVDEKIGKLGNRLGDFVEGMVAPALIQLFQARSIAVDGLSRDISRRNAHLQLATQIDLFAVNGDCCILIEVKSKCSIDDVNDHLERMRKFKPLFPEYADRKAYGAIAAMVMPDEVAKYAYRKGFFVLGQQGNNVHILNDERFNPMIW